MQSPLSSPLLCPPSQNFDLNTSCSPTIDKRKYSHDRATGSLAETSLSHPMTSQDLQHCSPSAGSLDDNSSQDISNLEQHARSNHTQSLEVFCLRADDVYDLIQVLKCIGVTTSDRIICIVNRKGLGELSFNTESDPYAPVS